jgi:hypothetical protein
MTTRWFLGAGVGVDGVETAAACLRVLMLDMILMEDSFADLLRYCRVSSDVLTEVAIRRLLICLLMESKFEGVRECWRIGLKM